MHTAFFKFLLLAWGAFCIVYLWDLIQWPNSFFVTGGLSVMSVIWLRCVPPLDTPRTTPVQPL